MYLCLYIYAEASAAAIVQLEDEAFDEGGRMRLPGNGDAVVLGAALFGNYQRRSWCCQIQQQQQQQQLITTIY